MFFGLPALSWWGLKQSGHELGGVGRVLRLDVRVAHGDSGGETDREARYYVAFFIYAVVLTPLYFALRWDMT